MSAMDDLNRLTIADFPDQYHDTIRLIGVKGFLAMMRTYGGTALYVPKADIVLRKVRDDKIKAEFNGHNYRKLAIKYGLTEITIRHILEGERDKPIPGQISMTDVMEAK